MKSKVQPFTIVPILQVRPGMLLAYDQVQWHHGRPVRDTSVHSVLIPEKKESPTANFKKAEAYSGQLTNHSRKRLQKAINLLVAQSLPKTAINFKTGDEFKFRVNFITLTLPAPQREVSDDEIKKKCLDNWLKTMRYRYKLASYVWRAERQYNGNIHFHITSDTYLPYDQICNVWNHQLSKFHFINEFESKNGHRMPNSTDVHSVQKIRNIAAYMVKYMSKSPDEHLKEINRKRKKKGAPLVIPKNHPFQKIDDQPRWDDPIQGKVWDCSQNLKIKESCAMEIDTTCMETINRARDLFPDRCSSFEHCWCCWLDEDEMMQVLSAFVATKYAEYLSKVRRWKPPD